MTTPTTIHEAGIALRAGSLTSTELVTACLQLADRLDPVLGTYLARFDETALAAAAQADADFAAGIDRGPLQGIPLGIKDIISTAEGPTTAQSLILDPAWGEAIGDAPVVARLRAAGAVITGKLSTMEFACGMPDATKPFPVPRNAWNADTWPGGSSSGTGSGVASGMVLGGLGTDTGGSIRLPASYSGISGLKATFGRVPKSGCAPLGYSFDNIGPMARSAWDCAAMLAVLAGYDPSDACCLNVPVDDYLGALDGALDGLTIGVERAHHLYGELVDPALPEVFEAAVKLLETAGAKVTEVAIPLYQELTDSTMLGWPGEAGAYHLNDLQTRWNDFGAATRMVIVSGVLMTSVDYAQCQRVRRVGQKQVAGLMEQVDLIVTPTTATGAPLIANLDFASLISSIFTPIWNATGNPALSVPMGFTASGLPLGLQIIGRPLEEATVLRAGDAYQRLTDWHLRLPELTQVHQPALG
jgi:aspartyl-tRNA(Asn)/glutamyl-tRNA(Gln) amidotransferase subunit A